MKIKSLPSYSTQVFGTRVFQQLLFFRNGFSAPTSPVIALNLLTNVSFFGVETFSCGVKLGTEVVIKIDNKNDKLFSELVRQQEGSAFYVTLKIG